jgi:hypothetical protein
MRGITPELHAHRSPDHAREMLAIRPSTRSKVPKQCRHPVSVLLEEDVDRKIEHDSGEQRHNKLP